jgi:AraC family transcriptional regulator
VKRQWTSALVTLSLVSHAEGRAVPEHAHARAFGTLLLRGGYQESVAQVRIEYAPLGFVYHPPGLVHRDAIASGGADFFTIEFVPSFLEGLGPAAGLHAVRDLTGGPAAWAMLRLLRDLECSDATPFDYEESAAQLIAELAGDPHADRSASEPAWLRLVDDILERSYAEISSLASLAGQAGVHPVHLSRVYRTRRGRGLRETLHRIRVRESCRLMALGRPLAEVALATGFADQSHFSNVFRRLTGTTPAVARRLLHLCAPSKR